MIRHGRPTVAEEDAAAVARVVRSGALAQGPEVAAFEAAVAERLGVEAGAAVASGSAALELALRTLGVGPGDDVLIPTFACDALYHAVTRCGARPVLVVPHWRVPPLKPPGEPPVRNSLTDPDALLGPSLTDICRRGI